MNPIPLQGLHGHETLTGEASLHGQRVKCPHCQTTLKEMFSTQDRAARQREGGRSTESMQSP